MNLKDQLRRDEGVVKHAYQDSLGFWTIGVGFLIDKRKGGKIPEPVMNFWLDYEISERSKTLAEKLPWFSSLDDARQGVLINMAFNLGVAGLLSFKRTLALIEVGKYKQASVEMLDSNWAKQVGERAARLSKQMETGEYV